MAGYIDKSERITWGVHKAFRSAACRLGNLSYGSYDTTSVGELIINEEEAKAIRRVFKRYLTVDIPGKITAGLQKQNSPSPYLMRYNNSFG